MSAADISCTTTGWKGLTDDTLINLIPDHGNAKKVSIQNCWSLMLDWTDVATLTLRMAVFRLNSGCSVRTHCESSEVLRRIPCIRSGYRSVIFI